MDDRTFDAMTRLLPKRTSRRPSLSMLGHIAFASGLMRSGTPAAAASCKQDGKKCKKKKDCCSEICQGKKCRCKKAQASCPTGFAARCCGALVCGLNTYGEGGSCCFPRGAVGCSDDCDCCGTAGLTICGGHPISRFCCSVPGTGCLKATDCCSLLCSNGTCA